MVAIKTLYGQEIDDPVWLEGMETKGPIGREKKNHEARKIENKDFHTWKMSMRWGNGE